MDEKMKVTIADQSFLQYGARSATLGGDRLGEGPQSFEWVEADPQEARFVTDGLLKHARGRGQVALLLEPYPMHPEDYQTAWERRHEFDAILAHSDATAWGALWYPHGGSWIKPEKWGMHEKTGNVSLIVGTKDSMTGHKLRQAVAERYEDRIDIYSDNYDKMETLAPYRYSIIIENVQTPGFWSEKLIDCLCVGTIPIYWGSLTGSNFNRNGIIEINSLDAGGTLLDTLGYLGSSHYAGRYDFALSNLKICRLNSQACEDRIFNLYPELFK